MAATCTRVLVVVAWLAIACGPAPAQPGAAAKPAPPAQAPAPAAAPPAAPSAPAAAPGAGAQGSGARVSATPLDPPQTVRVSYTQSAGEVPLYLGVDHGYFTELGLQIEMVRIPGSADSIVLLTTDQLEAAGLLITPAFYNAVARNVGVRMVGDRGSNVAGGRSSFNLAVRTDLLQQRPWSGYQDLRGMKVAIPQLGSMAEYYLERMLQRGGLQVSDVELVPLAFPDMAAGFANKGIDAALFLEPWATQQEEDGIIKKVASVDEVAPGSHTAALVYGDTFARNTAAARNFMVGWLRSVRHLTDANAGRRDFQDVVAALQKYTALKDEALIRKMPQTGMNPDGYLDPDNLATYQDWFAARGHIPQKADIAKVYDPSFAEYAVSVLGPYQPGQSARGSGG